jgi:hypothetical protein
MLNLQLANGIVIMAFPQIMRKPWSLEEVLQLRKLVKQKTPAHLIARKLNRSMTAVRMKASREGISLRLMPSSRSNENAPNRS